MNQPTKYYPNFPDTQENRAAISELIELIRTHYPEATFEVAPAPEDSQVVHLYATVDRIDTDELVDMVIAREMASPPRTRRDSDQRGSNLNLRREEPVWQLAVDNQGSASTA